MRTRKFALAGIGIAMMAVGMIFVSQVAEGAAKQSRSKIHGRLF